jgi:hypothetical protein
MGLMSYLYSKTFGVAKTPERTYSFSFGLHFMTHSQNQDAPIQLKVIAVSFVRLSSPPLLHF